MFRSKKYVNTKTKNNSKILKSQEALIRERSTLLSNLGGTISLYLGLSLYSTVELLKVLGLKLGAGFNQCQ